MNASKARKRFCHGPIGEWSSYRGSGHDMLYGVRLTFRKDGTGTIKEHCVLPAVQSDEEGEDPELEELRHALDGYDPTFQWKALGPMKLEITAGGRTDVVPYEFKDDTNEYGMPELRIHDLGRVPGDDGEIGFWRYSCSLLFHDPADEEWFINRLIRRFIWWW